MRAAFEGPRGFAAASAESGAELAAIGAYQAAAGSRPPAPDPLEMIGLWNADPVSSLGEAAAAFTAGDLRRTVEASSFAKAIWETARDVGRNRVLAVGASLAAVLLGLWLVFRWFRDRRIRRRVHRNPMMARRG
jgi:HAMP domain-containing protein